MGVVLFDSYALTSLENSILRDSPTSLHILDESSGTSVTDHTGNGHTGTHEDTGYVTQGAAGVPGGDGATSTTYAQHSSSPYGGMTTIPDSDDWAKQTITVEACFKTADASNSRRRFMQQQNTGNYWFFGLENQIPEWGHTNDSIGTFGGSGLCNNIWHHLLFERAPGANNVDCWVDGVMRSTHMSGGAALNVADEAKIGNVADMYGSAQECARASLAYVAFWGSAISDTRKAAHARKALNYPYVSVVTGQNNYGMSWTPSATKNISQITLQMHKGAGATGTVVLKVCSGTDYGTVIATSASVDVSGFGTSRGSVIFTFSTPFAVTSGVQYRWWIEGTSITGSVYLAIDRDGTYAGGDAFHFTSYPTYTDDTAHDVPFATYYNSGSVIDIAAAVSAGASATDRVTRERPLAGAVSGGASVSPTPADRLRMLRLYSIPNASAILQASGTWSIQAAATAGAAATCLLEDVASFAGVVAGASAVCSLDWANMSILEGRVDELAHQTAIMQCARCIRR